MSSTWSVENCVSFLDPLIESWDIDLTTFSMEIVLNRRLAPGRPKKFEFVEREPDQPEDEPGLKEFLNDSSLSGTATKEEMEFLKKLRFNGKRPTPLYYSGIAEPERSPPFPRGTLKMTGSFNVTGAARIVTIARTFLCEFFPPHSEVRQVPALLLRPLRSFGRSSPLDNLLDDVQRNLLEIVFALSTAIPPDNHRNSTKAEVIGGQIFKNPSS